MEAGDPRSMACLLARGPARREPQDRQAARYPEPGLAHPLLNGRSNGSAKQAHGTHFGKSTCEGRRRNDNQMVAQRGSDRPALRRM